MKKQLYIYELNWTQHNVEYEISTDDNSNEVITYEGNCYSRESFIVHIEGIYQRMYGGVCIKMEDTTYYNTKYMLEWVYDTYAKSMLNGLTSGNEKVTLHISRGITLSLIGFLIWWAKRQYPDKNHVELLFQDDKDRKRWEEYNRVSKTIYGDGKII